MTGTPASPGPETTAKPLVAGFIYPDHAAEDDYPLAEKLLGGDVALPVEHIYGTDLHAVAELLDLGSPARLAEGAALLAPHNPAAVVWACTSGSFVYGWDGAAEQVAKLSAAAGGLPASSTSFAFVRAAAALGLRKVAVAASYPDDVSTLFVEFLGRGGVEVLSMSAADIDTAAEVGELSPDAVVELIVSRDHPEADAVLVPDTAMRTLSLIDTVEQRLGKPVLTANQVTVWEGLRLAGATPRVQGLGALFHQEGA
ncbi:maleate cis-trans isomerase [Prauserella marina]|uniref:Maleate isomerase n=1 Tax=Prauserella marina TaxID=530584 RepID=A0A222VV57_9PSEU|nr:maleate cis-trans isomerase [Prauserella marina]ASR37836.1 maleate cis-trans isomerase [Prauserella marina]PWV75801.1 maleate isomerase [Prauserella marina]SDD25817.1 maleate isomerase [Prauserella marina]